MACQPLPCLSISSCSLQGSTANTLQLSDRIRTGFRARTPGGGGTVGVAQGLMGSGMERAAQGMGSMNTDQQKIKSGRRRRRRARGQRGRHTQSSSSSCSSSSCRPRRVWATAGCRGGGSRRVVCMGAASAGGSAQRATRGASTQAQQGACSKTTASRLRTRPSSRQRAGARPPAPAMPACGRHSTRAARCTCGSRFSTQTRS